MKTNKNKENYFEMVYLGKNNEQLLKGNQNLQKLLTAKALTSSIDSKRITSADLRRLAPKKLKGCNIITIDFDGFIKPYECI
jgi:hypothetical protein